MAALENIFQRNSPRHKNKQQGRRIPSVAIAQLQERKCCAPPIKRAQLTFSSL